MPSTTDAVEEAVSGLWAAIEQVKNQAMTPPQHYVTMPVWEWVGVKIKQVEAAIVAREREQVDRTAIEANAFDAGLLHGRAQQQPRIEALEEVVTALDEWMDELEGWLESPESPYSAEQIATVKREGRELIRAALDKETK